MNKNKLLSSIIVILLCASVASVFSAPSASAAETNLATFAFIACNPNPVGVGQALQVSFWLADAPPTASGAAGDRWESFTVTITNPTGTTETKGPFKSDAVGASYFVYYPSQAGIYTLVMQYSGQTITGQSFDYSTYTYTSFSNVYLPSTSNTATITVQADPVSGPASPSLPSSYWTRPITGINVVWNEISSNWLMTCWNTTSSANQGTFGTVAYSPEGTSPDSGHILWTTAMTEGGLVGGIYGDLNYHQGLSYEKFLTPAIINGYLYYNSVTAEQPIKTGTTDQQGIICVDLTTGEQVFTIPNATLTYGQILRYTSPNQAGAYAYLLSVSGSTWKYYDAFTGDFMWQITGVPSGTTMYGPSGELIVYSISSNSTGYYLNLWNSTTVLLNGDSQSWYYRPATGGASFGGSTSTGYTTIFAGSLGNQWSVAIQNYSQSIAGTDGANIVTKTGDTFTEYSMKDGSLVSKATLTIPTSVPVKESLSGLYSSMYSYLDNNGNYFSFLRFTMQWVCWNIKTGAVNWISEPYANAWGMYMSIEIEANGLLYAGGYDGLVQAYNVSTGKLEWSFSTGSAVTATPYGVWPIYDTMLINDGKVYLCTGEHGNGVTALYLGEAIYCVDAYTGEELWNATGWFSGAAMADGKIVAHNIYDNEIYCFGKGPSETTVSATAGLGNAVTIQGYVTDVSAGAKDLVASGEFNTVACVSDDSMKGYMAAVYQQQAMPTGATGVSVTVYVTDETCSEVYSTVTTSDASGHYALGWVPTATGTYTVTAVFDGTNGYYGSTAVTAIAVGETATTTVTPTTTPVETVAPTETASPTVTPSAAPETGSASNTALYVGIAAVVIIAAVIAVAMVLRRRK